MGQWPARMTALGTMEAGERRVRGCYLRFASVGRAIRRARGALLQLRPHHRCRLPDLQVARGLRHISIRRWAQKATYLLTTVLFPSKMSLQLQKRAIRKTVGSILRALSRTETEEQCTVSASVYTRNGLHLMQAIQRGESPIASSRLRGSRALIQCAAI